MEDKRASWRSNRSVSDRIPTSLYELNTYFLHYTKTFLKSYMMGFSGFFLTFSFSHKCMMNTTAFLHLCLIHFCLTVECRLKMGYIYLMGKKIKGKSWNAWNIWPPGELVQTDAVKTGKKMVNNKHVFGISRELRGHNHHMK